MAALLHLIQAQSQGPERFGTKGEPIHAAAEGQELQLLEPAQSWDLCLDCFCRTGIGPVHDAWQLITGST